MTKEELFNENIAIAYKLASSYKINYQEEYEDICQIALEELWKCCLNYDGIHSLTTYAYYCIPRKINYYLRSVKKHKEKDISINMPIGYSEKTQIYLEDTIPSDIDIETEVLDGMDLDIIKEMVEKLYIPDYMKKMFYLYLNGKTQYDIAKEFNCTQPSVSRIISKAKLKLRYMYNNLLKGGAYA